MERKPDVGKPNDDETTLPPAEEDGTTDPRDVDKVGTDAEERTIDYTPPVTKGGDAENAGGFPSDGRD